MKIHHGDTEVRSPIVLTYMKLTGKRVGLLINFNESVLHRGLVRRVL